MTLKKLQEIESYKERFKNFGIFYAEPTMKKKISEIRFVPHPQRGFHLLDSNDIVSLG